MTCRFASMNAGYASTMVGPTVQSTSAALVSSIAPIRAANVFASIRVVAEASAFFQPARSIAPDVHLQRLRVELELELLPERLDRARGVAAADAEADRVLRRRLRDEDDVDALDRERAEHAPGDAGDADHARPAQRQQRQVAD